MEQLIWSVIIIAFIIYTALKNRIRNRPSASIDRTDDAELKTRDENDRLGRYMEELLGIERPKTKPQIEIEQKPLKPLKEKVTTGEKTKANKRIGHLESPLIKEHRERQKPSPHEKRKVSHTKFPWGNLSSKDLPGAIILSEIIGPPISKRKSHRLF